MSYETARWFADTWGLVLLAILFLGLILWLFRKGSNKTYEHAARIPLDAPEDPTSDKASMSDQPTAKGDNP